MFHVVSPCVECVLSETFTGVEVFFSPNICLGLFFSLDLSNCSLTQVDDLQEASTTVIVYVQ